MNPEPANPEPLTPPIEPLAAPPVIRPPPIPTAAVASSVWGFWLTLAFGGAVAGGFLAAQTVVVVAFMTVGAATGHHYSLESVQSDGLLISIAACCSAPVMVGLSVLFAWLKHGLPVREYLGLKPVTRKGLWFSFLALAGVYGFWAVVGTIFDLPEVPQFMLDVYQTTRFLPLLWFAIVLAAPLAEEFFFRGFLFQGLLRSRLGATGTVLLTSLVWAVIHLQYGAVEITFVFSLGIALGCIRLTTGSIWLPFLIHAISNLIATAQVALLDK